jgi:hypothetical protein
MRETLTSRGLFYLAIAIAALPIAWAVSRIAGAGGAGPIYGAVTLAFGALLLAGLLVLERRPGAAVWLVAIGALGLCVLLFWMFFIVVPVAAALGAIAYSRARRSGWPSGAGGA